MAAKIKPFLLEMFVLPQIILFDSCLVIDKKFVDYDGVLMMKKFLQAEEMIIN